jgi:ADP-ribosyl-[dinitrogen reductase] hydrolase
MPLLRQKDSRRSIVVKPVPTLTERARGMLLGHATGNALGLPAQDLGSAAAIADRWPDGLWEVERRDTPQSPWDDDVALSVILAEELLTSPVDLRRIAARWADWARTDGRGIGRQTRTALEHFDSHGVPPAAPAAGEGNSMPRGAGNGALSRTLPLALATLNSRRNLISAAWHIAALTHPDPRAAWSAVAVSVAAARLLEGHRDFVPDVLEVLRANDSPAEVVEAVRRVPFERRESLPLDAGSAGLAVATLEVALWFAYHEPLLERGVVWLAGAGGDTDTNAAMAGGLMGARDGEGAVPGRWIAALPEAERLRQLADRLTVPHITQSSSVNPSQSEP